MISSSKDFSTYPPHRKLSTTRILPSRALSLLSAYLDASTQDASLHPNAFLAESGPKAPAASSTSTGRRGRRGGGLVLHNLRRVEAALKGEHLGTGAEVGFRGGLLEEGKAGGEDDGRRFQTSLRDPGVSKGNPAAAAAGTRGELEAVEGEYEWQDREEFEREQVVVGGGALGEKDMEVEKRDREMNEVEVPRVRETKSKGDKEERKRRKKQKRKLAREKASKRRQEEAGAES